MDQTSNLTNKKCVPCEGGIPPLTRAEFEKFLPKISDWQVVDDNKIIKTYTFKNFKEALGFVNKVGQIAEEEGHHPDINLHGWKKVTLTLSTHKVKGLSENDFIVAAKIDTIT